MKKLFALVCTLALALTCISVAGCGSNSNSSDADTSDSKYVGTWEATRATFADKEQKVEDIMQGPFILELKGDGSCEATMGQDKVAGTWSETKGGVKTKGTSDKLELTLEGQGGMLETTLMGVHFYLVKK